MRITRLRVAELRQFRQPYELADLQPGLNIFSGPNEAGKSTLVRAIRAAFFERHRSTSVDDLRPWGDGAAAPQVDVDFHSAGSDWSLSKSFLQRKRCELTVRGPGGTQRLEGTEAEDFIAEHLGFQFSAKGANRDEFLGIPGLLWIEQGAAQDLRQAVLHAADHLRRALDQGLGDVAASGGDEVVAQVRRLRDELLTGTGKPRGELARAEDEVATLAPLLDELQRAIATYRQQVDQLRALRDAHDADTRAQPWQALRQQQQAARQALQAAEGLQGELQRQREQLRQAQGLHALLLQRLADAERQRQGLATRQAALATASLRLDEAQATQLRCQQAAAAALAALQACSEALVLARQEDTRGALTRQAADAQARAAEWRGQLDRAGAEHTRAATLRREAAALQLAAADLKALRQQQARLAELAIEHRAIATRLAFELDPGVTLQLASGGQSTPVQGQAERLLDTEAVLHINGVGRVRITPGGRDLAALVQEQATLQAAQHALLQRLGLATPAEAEARQQLHAQRLTEADGADKACALLAPRGLDALAAQLHEALARQAEAAAALSRLPAAPASAAVPPLADAERAHRHQQALADAAQAQLQAAHQALATATSQHDAARHERDALQQLLDAPRQQAEQAQAQLDAVQAQAQLQAAQAAVSATEQRLAAARPDILRQDEQRFGRSADEAERAHQARDRQIAQLEATLAGAGAQGLEEQWAQRASELALATRRLAELRLRADALQLLLQRLEAQRRALLQRLQAPLQRHLERYLPLLFPAARLEVDASLVPGTLTRPGAQGLQTGDVDALSFGAREQMGVISRLAYADLLQEGGRPTLVILDDALVHSDEQRLAQMKRVLFDAAQRHQVLLFTCHPQAWRDMGVALRPL